MPSVHPFASPRLAIVAAALALGTGLGASACTFHPPPPLPEELAGQKPTTTAPNEAGAVTASVGPPQSAGEEPARPTRTFKPGDEPPPDGMTRAEVLAYNAAQGDPANGVFTLEQALVGLGTAGELWARIDTSRGVIECKLFEKQAPVTVANFVGLARGLRPSRDPKTGDWGKRKWYDGNTFHRVHPGFMIQGGDPTATGLGNAGYVLPDEIIPELIHDRAGLLSMANKGPTSASTQFFVTLGPASHLDGMFTIFGECSEQGIAVAESISAAPRNAEDILDEPERIETIEITRR